MTRVLVFGFGILLASAMVTGCSYENTTKLLTPTAPSGSSTGSSSSGATSSPASAFLGAWGSSTIAGLPIGNCSDLKWLITEQSATSVGGTLSATCAGGVTVNATLAGELRSAEVIDLKAKGTILAFGIPCPFDIAGLGARQTNDAMKIDYTGSYCLGAVNGTETLRRRAP